MTDHPPDPGWYPDPEDSSRVRYWDGQTWTDRTGKRGQGGAGNKDAEPERAPGAEPPSERRWRVPLALGLVVLLAAGVAAFFVLSGSEEAAGAEVILEPTASTGTDPFTDSVANEEVEEITSGGTELAGDPVEGISGGDASVESIEGAAPGLYGGTGEEATCDPEALVEFLEQNPEQGAAFAEVLGITPDQIPDYVAGLTPVLLREDTRVTNHGFAAGQATPFQAVLQAGTAVMVDDRGVPRVRCACGNPLAEPDAAESSPEFGGEQWEGFDQGRLVAVAPSPERVESFELVDVTTGETYEQTAGSLGDVRDLVVDFGGIGNLRLGMTAKEASAATGLGVEVGPSRFPGFEGCSPVTIPELEAVHGLASDGRTIDLLFVSDPKAESTEGVGIGSTRQEVERAYPEASEEAAPFNPEYSDISVEGDGGILQFSVGPDDRVSGINVGLPSGIDAIVGCE
jgi:hypothetical protein